MSERKICVIGAGPVGLEAALYARSLGLAVEVYEAGAVGNHLRAWGHVRMFTPWSMNVSSLGARRLGLARREGNPTGAELVAEYLEPLARLPELADAVRERTRVVAASRAGFLKGDGVGDGTRAGRPFRLLLETPSGDEEASCDVLLDASGVFGQPNALGASGIPAPGERACAVVTGLPDVRASRAAWEGKRVAVVGGGFSAATTVTALAALGGTHVEWITRGGTPPVREIADDPLPERLGLARRANRLATDLPSGFRHHPGAEVARLRDTGKGIEILLTTGGTVTVDAVVNQTGFRPDASITRELQVHHCYASEGPMNLAAALLGAAGGDCMSQTGFGPESLASPEPDFFLLGHKSYGRNPEFLLRIGREQVRDVFRLITGNGELDLYEAEEAHAG